MESVGENSSKLKLQLKKMLEWARLVEEFCKELGSTNMVMGS